MTTHNTWFCGEVKKIHSFLELWWWNITYPFFRPNIFQPKNWFFLFCHKNIHCGYLLEVHCWEIRKKILISPLIWSYNDKTLHTSSFVHRNFSASPQSNLQHLHLFNGCLWRLRSFLFRQFLVWQQLFPQPVLDQTSSTRALEILKSELVQSMSSMNPFKKKKKKKKKKITCHKN